MTWWITQPGRAQAERVALADLQERSPWLRNVSWRLAPELRLVADVEIAHEDEVFPLTLTYLPFFPDAPPTVVPSDGRRISGHQYGAGGELCLEFRADNWEPSFTGAMLLESAHRLIVGERGPEGDAAVPSAHSVTVGQELRASSLRFLVSPAAARQFEILPEGVPRPISIAIRLFSDNLLSTVASIGEGPEWTEDMPMPEAKSCSGAALRLSIRHSLPQRPTFADLSDVLHRDLTDVVTGLQAESDIRYLLLVDPSGPRLFVAYDRDGERQLSSYSTFMLPDDEDARAHPEHVALAGKRVAVVGCGSLGSKVASSLARAGARKFLLVDHDILYPGNLVRNDLDWRAVGSHKVEGTQERLKEILKGCEVVVRRVALGGQESADTTLSVMRDLSDCDLIVDFTADPHVFNYCAAVARAQRKPMVWAEVFGGGIGGIVARARPGMDPPPHIARRQISAWCEATGVAAPAGPDGDYSSLDGDRPPLVADDADVTVIAGHASRLAIDTLARHDTSIFPQSAYAVGLSAGWIFVAPFDTYPIGYAPEGAWGAVVDEGTAEQALQLIKELLPASEDD